MKTQVLQWIKLTLVCIVLCCVLYPLSIWLIAQTTSSHGNGETVTHKNSVVGFKLVGQKVRDVAYWCSRPSAVDYNGAGSGGSNKSNTNPVYLAQVHANLDSIVAHNPGVQRAEIPSELVCASGSGLDPHISIESAMVQIARIADKRHCPSDALRELVNKHIQQPFLGIFGPSVVNVLEINCALDDQFPMPSAH